MFKMLGNLTKAALNVAVTPIDAVKDVAKAFDPYDNTESNTIRRLKEAGKNLDKALDADEDA